MVMIIIICHNYY